MDTGTFPIPEASMPPLEPPKERLDARGNGYGTCSSCKKYKRLWARLCMWCGESCA